MINKINFFIALWIICLSVLPVCLNASPKKHALIVAVDDYPCNSGWGDLNGGPINDVRLMSNLLDRQGFRTKNIKILINEEAKKDCIVSALKKLAKDVREGDICLILFSMHGQKMWDDDTTEEWDGYDESLIPYDAKKDYKEGVYVGEKHLRDDELNVLLLKIRKRLGPDGQLLVLLDACHSEGGTRAVGVGANRGGYAFAPADYRPVKNKTFSYNFLEGEKSDEDRICPMVVFSACEAKKTSAQYKSGDGNEYGPLTYAFYRALTSSTLPDNPTYRDVFSRFDTYITYQLMIAEPDSNLDRIFLDGSYVYPEVHYRAKVVSNRIELNAGVLLGINDSAEVAFYPPYTYERSKVTPYGKAMVVKSGSIKSILELNSPLEDSIVRQSWIFVDKYTYSNNIISVNTALLKNPFKASVVGVIEKMPAFHCYTNESHLVLSKTEDSLLIMSENKVFRAINLKQEHWLDTMEEALVNYRKYFMAKQINMNDKRYDVQLDLLPVKVKDGTIVDTLNIQTFYQDGNLVFPNDIMILLSLENKGKKPAYCALLFISPTMEVHVFPIEEKIPPASMVKLEKLDLNLGSLPHGETFMFKVISTKSEENIVRQYTTKRERETNGNRSFERESRSEEVLSDGCNVDVVTFSVTQNINN